MDIEAVIAEAPASAEATPVTDETQTDATTPEADAKAEPKENESEAEPADKPWPKKAENALWREKGKTAEWKAKAQSHRKENERLKAELSALKAPKESDFEGKPYGDYLKAEAKHAAKEERLQSEANSTEESLKAAEATLENERSAFVNNNYREAVKAIPDYDQVVNSSLGGDGRIPMSDELKEALYETDNPAFTLYQVIKEGALQELNALSTAKVAMALARFEDKAMASAKTKPVTNAPAPLSPAKGNATAGKSVEQMTGKDLLKAVRSG